MKQIISFAFTHKIKAVAIIALVIAGFTFLGEATTQPEVVEDVLPVVTVTSAANLSGEQEVSTVGTVRAFSEAVITAEVAGRVTSVNATLGQTVLAGFVVATLENSSQQAAVLQAEGVYEAALAAADQSGVGVNEAQTNLKNAQNRAVSTFADTYNTVNGIVRNNIDTFFSNPDSRVPGVKLDAKNNTAFLNNERVAYQSILSNWLIETTALTTDSDLTLALTNASDRVNRTIAIVDVLIAIFNADNTDKAYTDDEMRIFSTTFNGLRSNLLATETAINNSLAALENAEDALRRAEIGATGAQSSASDAQVKQALGSLRAAQANLAKTILRTPIPGTINTIDVRVGDFVGNQQVVARVANNNALEIVTYVGDNELNAFVVGGTVVIEDSFEGTVTEIAPAVDPITRKTEVRIAIETEEIQNGDTVKISKTFTTEADQNQPVIIPISAVKFEIENGYIFTVENNKLVSRPVEIGAVRGGSVEITSGLSQTEEFVLDARGLLADSEVEVRTR